MPIRETTRDEMIGNALTSGAVTWDALHETGPGKFEVPGDRPLTVALYGLSLRGVYDEQTGEVEAPNGWIARIDRWLLFEDTQGFVSSVEYDTEVSAKIAFGEYEGTYAEWCDED